MAVDLQRRRLKPELQRALAHEFGDRIVSGTSGARQSGSARERNELHVALVIADSAIGNAAHPDEIRSDCSCGEEKRMARHLVASRPSRPSGTAGPPYQPY